MLMFERFTDRALKALALANQEAHRFDHTYIDTEHILLGVLREGSGVGVHALMDVDVDLHILRAEVERKIKGNPNAVNEGRLPQTTGAKRVIELAIEEARGFNHSYVGTEHIVLGLLREQNGLAAQVLTHLGVEINKVRHAVTDLLGIGDVPQDGSSSEARRSFESYKNDPRAKRFVQCLDAYDKLRKEALEAGDYERADRLIELMHEMSRRIEDFFWRLKD